MKTLFIATSNPGKIKMFKELLVWEKIDLKFINDFEINFESPEENWKTTRENALIKAKYYFNVVWLPVLSDDAGFEIDELDGEPGIMARRWWGALPDNVSDEDWLNFYQNKVAHINADLLNWSFPFTRCLYKWENECFFQDDKIKFYLTKEPKWPYVKGSPISSLRVLLDWRHELDLDRNDAVLLNDLKKEWLMKLLKNL